MKGLWVLFLFLFLSVVIFSSDQYIYSQIAKDNLVKSDQYIIDGLDLENEHSVFSIEIGDMSLKEFLNSDSTYDKSEFSKIENKRYRYEDINKPMVEFKLKKNKEKPKESTFSLTKIDDSKDIPTYKKMIDESYVVPSSITNFREEDLENSKNTFFYDDEYKLEHLIAYKYQEVVYRLYLGEKINEIRPIKKIEEKDNLKNFYEKDDYIDFVFEDNKIQQVIVKDGITGKYIDGKFELIGLEDKRPYNLDLYTLRYKNNNNIGNYVVVTYESTLTFYGKNQSSIEVENIGWLEDIDISNYKDIKLNIITLTSKKLSQIELKNITEKRKIPVNTVSDIIISTPISLSGTYINIGGTNYKVVDDQITIDENNKKYVYRWEGSYESDFIEKKGDQREVSFEIEGKDLIKQQQVGIYIEPTIEEKYDEYPKQWIIFESLDSSGKRKDYQLKDQSYQIKDRILTPERCGYRQIKSVDYETTLKGYLSGGDYKFINRFRFYNNRWRYLVDEDVEGIMIEKIISETKGELIGDNNFKLEFYTDDMGQGLEQVENIKNKVVYS